MEHHVRMSSHRAREMLIPVHRLNENRYLANGLRFPSSESYSFMGTIRGANGTKNISAITGRYCPCQHNLCSRWLLAIAAKHTNTLCPQKGTVPHTRGKTPITGNQNNGPVRPVELLEKRKTTLYRGLEERK